MFILSIAIFADECWAEAESRLRAGSCSGNDMRGTNLMQTKRHSAKNPVGIQDWHSIPTPQEDDTINIGGRGPLSILEENINDRRRKLKQTAKTAWKCMTYCATNQNTWQSKCMWASGLCGGCRRRKEFFACESW